MRRHTRIIRENKETKGTGRETWRILGKEMPGQRVRQSAEMPALFGPEWILLPGSTRWAPEPWG